MQNKTKAHDDLLTSIISILDHLWLKRWLILGVSFLIAIPGWGIVGFVISDKYESIAKVHVDTKSILRPLLKGIAVDSDFTPQFAYITQRTLLVNSNLERVILDAGLDTDISNQGEKERLIHKLRDEIKVKGKAKDNIYSISYIHQDPLMAYKVVKILLDIFVEGSLKGTRNDSNATEKFIDQQIVDYEVRLIEAEEKLKSFKRRNIGMMPTQIGGYFDRLTVAKDKLSESRLQLKEMEKRKDELTRLLQQIEEYLPGSIIIANTEQSVGSRLDQRIDQLEEELDLLLLKYTEVHPHIVSLQQMIEYLYAKKTLKAETPEQQNIKQKNPVYQELKISIGTVRSDIAAFGVRVEEHEKDVDELTDLLDTIPQVEAELAQLNRDYSVNKTNYEVFLERRESAKLSKDAEQSADKVKIKILESPKEAALPLSPNRPLLIIFVLLISIGSGVGIAWLLSMANQVLLSKSDLKMACEFPVYGSVALIMDKKQRRRKVLNSFFFVFAVCLFVGLFITTLAWQVLGIFSAT